MKREHPCALAADSPFPSPILWNAAAEFFKTQMRRALRKFNATAGANFVAKMF
jgi:hypothetical protein